jgi:hypothetical protein
MNNLEKSGTRKRQFLCDGVVAATFCILAECHANK